MACKSLDDLRDPNMTFIMLNPFLWREGLFEMSKVAGKYRSRSKKKKTFLAWRHVSHAGKKYPDCFSYFFGGACDVPFSFTAYNQQDTRLTFIVSVITCSTFSGRMQSAVVLHDARRTGPTLPLELFFNHFQSALGGTSGRLSLDFGVVPSGARWAFWPEPRTEDASLDDKDSSRSQQLRSWETENTDSTMSCPRFSIDWLIDLFICLSVTNIWSAHEGDYGMLSTGKSLRGDKSLFAAEPSQSCDLDRPVRMHRISRFLLIFNKRTRPNVIENGFPLLLISWTLHACFWIWIPTFDLRDQSIFSLYGFIPQCKGSSLLCLNHETLPVEFNVNHHPA